MKSNIIGPDPILKTQTVPTPDDSKKLAADLLLLDLMLMPCDDLLMLLLPCLKIPWRCPSSWLLIPLRLHLLIDSVINKECFTNSLNPWPQPGTLPQLTWWWIFLCYLMTSFILARSFLDVALILDSWSLDAPLSDACNGILLLIKNIY